MRLLNIILCCSVLVLVVLIIIQPAPTTPYADGRLASLPMPGRVVPRARVVLPAATPAPVLTSAGSGPVRPVSARLEVLEASSATHSASGARVADAAEWGIMESGGAAPPIIAKVVQPLPVNTPAPAPSPTPAISVSIAGATAGVTPKPAEPKAIVVASANTPTAGGIPVPALPIPTIAPISAPPIIQGPNLYLPEGATNEEGALLTLIRPELRAFEVPDSNAAAAPFVLREGEQVRPLTRLRSDSDFDWIKFNRNDHDWWAQAEYFIRVDPRNKSKDSAGNLLIGAEAVDKNSALPLDYKPDDLVTLPKELLTAEREIKVRREVGEALGRMIRAAEGEGHHIRVFSGFRDFAYQKKLYLETLADKGPKQNGTAAPGYSEHQLGTTIDVSNTDRKFVLSAQFAATPEGKWLSANAAKYGFRNSYTQENTDESGYKPEPWHLRYIGVTTHPTPAEPPKAVAVQR